MRSTLSKSPSLAAWCLLLVVGLGLGACSTAAPQPGPGPAPEPSPIAMGADPMVPIGVQGDRVVRGGQPWWFVGYNSFVWSGNCGNPDEHMSAEDVDRWFASMRHDGHGAVRLFFFAGWDVARLDAAVASARRHHVYLMITLGDARADCGERAKDASWFADAAARAEYQSHLTMLLQRYRGDPTIAWFEYLNEPDGADGALRPFYDEMGAVAEGIDPTRLFSSGTLAPYAVGGADEFRTITESPGVDVASLHEYDEDEVESNHGPETREASAGKPVLVGEFGITAGPSCPVDFDERARRVDAKVTAYLDAGYAGALEWAWQPGGSSACELGNLDADPATQQALRTAGTS